MNGFRNNAAPAEFPSLPASAKAASIRQFQVTDNRLLARLPEADRRYLGNCLDLVQLAAGDTLDGAGCISPHVYFPLDCIVSIVHLTQDGGTAEVAMVGREGMVGVGVFIGGNSSRGESIVQCPGFAYRVRLALFREHFNRSAAVRDLMMHYMQMLLAQSTQTALCNRHHAVEQQLCRWLLAATDRLGTNDLAVTQEAIANALGVRRQGINEAAGRLQKEALIRFSRGKLEVLDRTRMERRACECYRVLKSELQRMLPDPRPGSREMLNGGTLRLTPTGQEIRSPVAIRPAAPETASPEEAGTVLLFPPAAANGPKVDGSPGEDA